MKTTPGYFMPGPVMMTEIAGQKYGPLLKDK